MMVKTRIRTDLLSFSPSTTETDLVASTNSSLSKEKLTTVNILLTSDFVKCLHKTFSQKTGHFWKNTTIMTFEQNAEETWGDEQKKRKFLPFWKHP